MRGPYRPSSQKRAKPAVPLGGKYRLVDIPISNCLLSGDQLYRMDYGELLQHISNLAPMSRWVPPRSTGKRLRALGFCTAMPNDTFFAL